MAADIVKRSEGRVGADGDPQRRSKKTNLETVVGPNAWAGKGPVKNVAKTPMVGGQWRNTKSGPWKHEIVVVVNDTAPQIPVAGQMEAYSLRSVTRLRRRSSAP